MCSCFLPAFTMPGDSSECIWMLSKHCEISLIHASLSWAVGATRCIECLWPDFPSTKILKSRLFAFTGSVTLKLLLCVDAEQSDSSSSFAFSLGSSISVASTRGIFPTSGNKCKRPADVLWNLKFYEKIFFLHHTNLVAIIMWFEKRKHCRTDSRSLLKEEANRLRILPLPGGTWTKLPVYAVSTHKKINY